MNSRERIFTALEGGTPDLIPYVEPRISNALIKEYGGNDFSYFDFIEEFDLDGAVILQDYEKPGAGWAGWKEERIDDNLVDKWGTVRKSGRGEYYSDLGGEYSPVKSLKDLESFSPPELKRKNFENLFEAVKRFKGEKAIILRLRDVWSIPRALLGYEKMLMSTKLNKKLLTETIKLCLDFNKRVIEFASEIGAEVIWAADDIADNNGLLVSPDTYCEIFLPYLKELIDYCKKFDLYFIKHTDGYIMNILKDFIEAGVDCINPVEPYAGMSIKEIKNKFDNTIATMGNVDNRNILPEGSKSEIEEEVKNTISEGRRKGAYIFSSSNSIHRGIPLENYLTMIRTWKEYR